MNLKRNVLRPFLITAAVRIRILACASWLPSNRDFSRSK